MNNNQQVVAQDTAAYCNAYRACARVLMAAPPDSDGDQACCDAYRMLMFSAANRLVVPGPDVAAAEHVLDRAERLIAIRRARAKLAGQDGSLTPDEEAELRSELDELLAQLLVGGSR